MTGARALAVDHLRRSRLRVHAIEALIDACDPADAIHESLETVELAIRALLRLRGVPFHRGDGDLSRLLRESVIEGRLLERSEIDRIENVANALRRDRELSFYGDEDVIPLEDYRVDDARKALRDVLGVVDLVGQAFERDGMTI